MTSGAKLMTSRAEAPDTPSYGQTKPHSARATHSPRAAQVERMTGRAPHMRSAGQAISGAGLLGCWAAGLLSMCGT